MNFKRSSSSVKPRNNLSNNKHEQTPERDREVHIPFLHCKVDPEGAWPDSGLGDPATRQHPSNSFTPNQQATTKKSGGVGTHTQNQKCPLSIFGNKDFGGRRKTHVHVVVVV